MDAERARLRDAFVRERGYWSTALDDLLELDPGFFECVLRVTGHPWRHGVLDRKTKELILLAVDAAATHRNGPGAREHVERALAHGATPDEIMEVLELTSTVGIHTCTTAVPILLEELAAVDRALDFEHPLTARQQQLKAEFIDKRAYWNDFWDGILRLDPEFFAAYSALSAHPWEHGSLQPKVRELVYAAFDAAATHLYEPGLRQHIRNAMGYGATPEELMEVFELASGIGVEACILALPALRAAATTGHER